MGACLPCLGSSFTEEERKAATVALLAGAKAKDKAACQKALKGGADVNAANTTFFNYTALHLFAGQGNAEMCSVLLAAGAVVDPRSSSDETPLIMAARSKHRAVCDILLAAGADKEASTNYAPPMRKTAQQYLDDM